MQGHEELLATARAETGLEDFGDDSFLEGLQVLVRSLRDEAHLNAAGEHLLRQRIIGHLRQRLEIEDWYRRHPEIAKPPSTYSVWPLIMAASGRHSR